MDEAADMAFQEEDERGPVISPGGCISACEGEEESEKGETSILIQLAWPKVI